MRAHFLPVLFLLAALSFAVAWVVTLSYVGAAKAQPGENLLAVFASNMSSGDVATVLGKVSVRQFVSLDVGNVWIVQAEKSGVALELTDSGALIVLRASGPIHFALGCGINGPIRPPSTTAALKPS